MLTRLGTIGAAYQALALFARVRASLWLRLVTTLRRNLDRFDDWTRARLSGWLKDADFYVGA